MSINEALAADIGIDPKYFFADTVYVYNNKEAVMDDIRHTLPEKPTRFMDCLRHHIRKSGLSYKTEQTYTHWIKRYIHFHGKKHPKDLTMKDVEAFLNYLSINRNCSISTQKIVLNAMVYLYKRFMGVDVGQLNFTTARDYRRLPIVYSREEIAAILNNLRGIHRTLVELM